MSCYLYYPVIPQNMDLTVTAAYISGQGNFFKLTWCAYNRHPKFPSPFWSLSKFCFYEGHMSTLLSTASYIKETLKIDLGISGVCYMHTMLK